MTVSYNIAMSMLSEKRELSSFELGFVTTVFRDNASSDEMNDYFSMVLALINIQSGETST